MKKLRLHTLKAWQLIGLMILSMLLYIILYSVAEIPFMMMELQPLEAGIIAFVASTLLMGSYIGLRRWLEKKMPSDINFKKFFTNIGGGLAIGLILFVGITATMKQLGYYRVESVAFTKDFFVSLALFLVVACGEELIFRGIMFRFLDEKWNTGIALLVSAFFFGIVHYGNDNGTLWSSMAIAIEAGLMLGLSYKMSGSIWMPIGIHWAWNTVQGPVFGFAVSGNDFGRSIITPVVEGPELMTGGEFGAEASIIAVALSLLISGWMYYRLRTQHR